MRLAVRLPATAWLLCLLVAPMPLSIATFNVKNLLEPAGERDRAVLPQKLAFIARALARCDADVVGLQEVGGEELVRAVLEQPEAPRGYGEPLLGAADARGIRCALLSRLRIGSARVHTASALPFPAFVAGDPSPFGARLPLRRGIVHARVDAVGVGPVDVMVVHFKSPRPVAERDASGREREGLGQASPRAKAEGTLRSLVWRAAEALHVRGIVDEVLRSTAGEQGPARVVVIGDMNDTPDSPVLRTLRAWGDGALFDCTSNIEDSARFSLIHDGRRTQLDHILASAGLYSRLQSARFLNEELREHEGSVEADAMTVDSDHAALVARFA
jgi:endonuclease/exonuclease/phosphatase family metal-dependent hydrolase